MPRHTNSPHPLETPEAYDLPQENTAVDIAEEDFPLDIVPLPGWAVVRAADFIDNVSFMTYLGEHLAKLDGDRTELILTRKRILAALPQSDIRDDLIGPFYNTSGVADWRKVTRQAISKLAASRQLLAVKTGDGDLLFPSFQFDEFGRTSKYLPEILSLLDPEARDNWGDAIWLNSTVDSLGMTPYMALQSADENLCRYRAQGLAQWCR